ncbi:MAG: DUF1731 domain-containing protein [Planctomycetota bacterium]
MKIVLAGGSGQIGRVLAEHFVPQGEEVVVLTRGDVAGVPAGTTGVPWDGVTAGPWCDGVDGSDVVINLAGRTVNCRYHDVNRRQIVDSRVDSTRVLGAAIAKAAAPPRVWLQSSTATIYADAGTDPSGPARDESGPIGGDEPDLPDTWRFSIDVATSWERACHETDTPNTRKVLLRSAMTMSPHRDGVFDVLFGLVRKGLGGRQGGGGQYISWIHDADFVAAVDRLIADESLDGPVNLAAPHPLPNAEFMRTLRRAAGVPVGLPATALMVEVGAFFMRTESELVLKSRRVVPGRLLDAGFEFVFPEWEAAATDLVARRRALA